MSNDCVIHFVINLRLGHYLKGEGKAGKQTLIGPHGWLLSYFPTDFDGSKGQILCNFGPWFDFWPQIRPRTSESGWKTAFLVIFVIFTEKKIWKSDVLTKKHNLSDGFSCQNMIGKIVLKLFFPSTKILTSTHVQLFASGNFFLPIFPQIMAIFQHFWVIFWPNFAFLSYFEPFLGSIDAKFRFYGKFYNKKVY